MARTSAAKTPIFVWQGKNKRGQIAKGEMPGHTPALVKAQLRKQGIIPSKVYKKRESLFSFQSKKITKKDIALLIRQLATMTKSGIALVQSLEVVADGVEKDPLKKLITTIRDDIASGTSFAQSLKKHPRYFDNLTCSLIHSGEQSGELELVLDNVASYKEKMLALTAKIKKATNYPIFVVAVAVVITVLLLLKVVPTFTNMFLSFGASLPVATQIVVNLSEFMQSYWVIMLMSVAGSIYLFKYFRKNSKSFADSTDKLALRLPVFGNILQKSAIARFCRVLSTTFSAGVPLIEALDSVSNSTGNAVYRDAIKRIKDNVATGQQLHFAMRNSQVFPNMSIQMVAVGEESGNLDTMLSKAAAYYEDEVDNAVDNMTSLLEPALMVVLGILVGGLVIAMYLPIFQIGNVI